MYVLQPNCVEDTFEEGQFFKTLRPKKRTQPVCQVCEKALVENEGDLCPGCETFAHVNDRAVPEDQAALGRFC